MMRRPVCLLLGTLVSLTIAQSHVQPFSRRQLHINARDVCGAGLIRCGASDCYDPATEVCCADADAHCANTSYCVTRTDGRPGCCPNGSSCVSISKVAENAPSTTITATTTSPTGTGAVPVRSETTNASGNGQGVSVEGGAPPKPSGGTPYLVTMSGGAAAPVMTGYAAAHWGAVAGLAAMHILG